jgi:MinD-like ATPase involved in chromosome partitioning or flagellar assembly
VYRPNSVPDPQQAGYAPQDGPPPNVGQEFAAPPTAADFAARRSHRPEEPPAVMGVPGLLRKLSFGYMTPSPSQRELGHRQAVTAVRRNFGGLRQITVVNPKGGAGKTVSVLMIAMTFGQQRGGYVLSWDNNETQGTLGMRAQQDFHHRTVRDLMAELVNFTGEGGRVGDLSRYVRAQGEAMFDVLASDESATAGEMLTAQAFRDLREVVSRFYKLIVVDTGNNVRAENWQAAIEDTAQLVVPMSARGDSAETAARMLDHLDQTGRSELVRRAVSVISMPASTKGADLAAIRNHFSARTRTVLIAPYEPLLDSGEPIQYGQISPKSKEAWLSIAAAIAEGL